MITWQIHPLTGGRGLVGGTYRVNGTAGATGETGAWSLVLKIVSEPDGGGDPHEMNYWKREFLAYQTGLLERLPGGISAPRCYGAVDHPGRDAWLWLEDIPDVSDLEWSPALYGRAARHLGQFNGAYLAGRSLPEASWLNARMLRAWLVSYAPDERLSFALEQPIVRRFCPPSQAERLRRLWAERDTFLDALERLPHTFCHLDTIRRNLHLRSDPDEGTVAIDWEFTGLAAVGEELVPLVAGSLAMLSCEPSMAGDVEEASFEGYLDGLRDAGWRGDSHVVRFSHAAASALRFGLVWGIWLATTLGADPNGQASVEGFYDRPVDEVVERFAVILPFLLNRGDEARDLLAYIPA